MLLNIITKEVVGITPQSQKAQVCTAIILCADKRIEKRVSNKSLTGECKRVRVLSQWGSSIPGRNFKKSFRLLFIAVVTPAICSPPKYLVLCTCTHKRAKCMFNSLTGHKLKHTLCNDESKETLWITWTQFAIGNLSSNSVNVIDSNVSHSGVQGTYLFSLPKFEA